MRTAEEIHDYTDANGHASFFGFDREAMVPFLTFEEAKPWLKEDAKEENWSDALPRTREAILGEIADYLNRVGFDKAVNHRGISAGRTVEKLRALCWLMEDDEAVRLCDAAPYANYGAPILKAVAEHLGIDWKAELAIDDIAIFEAQARGEICPACKDGSESGCGN